MRVISFDLSLTASGHCTAVDGKVLDYGLVVGKGEGVLRLIANRNRVMERVDALKPDLVVFEDFSYGSMDGKAFERAGMAYMIRAELATDHIPFVTCSPMGLKKFIVGTAGSAKNKVTKDLVIKEVYKKLGHDLTDNNVADAVVLAYVGMALLGDWTPTMKAQEEVLTTIRKSQAVPVRQTVDAW